MRGSWICPAGVLHPVSSLVEHSRHRSQTGLVVYLRCGHDHTAIDFTPWRDISPHIGAQPAFEHQPAA